MIPDVKYDIARELEVTGRIWMGEGNGEKGEERIKGEGKGERGTEGRGREGRGKGEKGVGGGRGGRREQGVL